MKIVILTGSPHKKGTSSVLVDNFIKGAETSGHEIFRFDCAFKKVHPCIGCDKCECGKNSCVFKDDMLELYPKLIGADMIVFSTPLYYHAMSAQIKMTIDRFHGIDNCLKGTGKKAVLLVSAADEHEYAANGVIGNYEETLRYLQWQDCGKVLGLGCNTKEDILKTNYPKEAYKLGQRI